MSYNVFQGASYNILALGGKGDGVYIYDGAITSGSAIFTSATGSFTAADVGKVIKINGAGASGRDLSTTILSRQSATQVTLSVNASTSVSAIFAVYGTDDTTAIQAVINTICALPSPSGTIWFPNGVYVINGALQTSISSQNPNCQLYMPVVSNITSAIPHVKFMGETPPFMGSYRNSTSPAPMKHGVTLHSTLVTASGTLPSMISGCNTSVSVSNATLVRLDVRNICIRISSNATLNGVVISGINAARIQQFCYNNLEVDTDCNAGTPAVQPTNECAGVICPQLNTSNNTRSNNLNIAYFKYGLITGELGEHGGVSIAVCYYPVVFTKGNYPTMITRLGLTSCPYSVLVASSTIFSTYAGTSYFNLKQLSCELLGAVGNWRAPIGGLLDSDNNGIGEICFSNVDSTILVQTPFLKSGGASVSCRFLNTIGQMSYGGIDPSYNLIFNSTTDSTKGLIAFGNVSTGFIYDESTNRIGIGGAPTTYPLEVYENVNLQTRIQVKNTNSGTAAQAQVVVLNNNALSTALTIKSSGFTTSGLVKANCATLLTTATDSFVIGCTASVPMIFVYGGTAAANEVARLDSAGMSFQVALTGLKFKVQSNGLVGRSTLVAGVKAITITGLTTSHKAYIQLQAAGGTTGVLQAVCTADTLTITAIVAGGIATQILDTSTFDYFIVLTN